MGIRFYCPNGHKLNVKEFQAGKRGICPFCGIRIDIPTESTRESSKRAKDAGPPTEQTPPPSPSPEATSSSMPAPTGPAINQPLPEPSAWPTEAIAVPPEPPSGAPSPPSGPTSAAPPQQPAPGTPTGPVSFHGQPQPTATAATPPSGPAPPTAPPPAPGEQAPPDPLVEAGDVVWYVRPASGGQFGPAAADVMRSWIDEGRVSADSLVWHEGWRDWKEASEVFPQLSDTTTGVDVESIAAGTGSRASALRSDRVAARRRSQTTQTAVIVGLILAVVILLIFFLLIISGAFAQASVHDGFARTLTSTLAALWPSLLSVT